MENMKSVELEIPLSVSVEALWGGIIVGGASKRCPLPEVVPEVYASVEGPWLNVGSVLRVKFNNGMRDCKWTITAMDLDARSITCTWVEEEGPMAMRSHVITGVYMATGEASSSVNISIHFDGKVSAEYAQAFKDTLTQQFLLASSRLTPTAQPN